MSSADGTRLTEFDEWLADMVRRHGEFTVLVILAGIEERRVVPLSSAFMHVMGGDIDWEGMRRVFAGSGRDWDGAALFPTKASDGGPIDNATARRRLAELEAKVMENRMILNDGHFFDRKGRRIEIAPIAEA